MNLSRLINLLAIALIIKIARMEQKSDRIECKAIAFFKTQTDLKSWKTLKSTLVLK